MPTEQHIIRIQNKTSCLAPETEKYFNKYDYFEIIFNEFSKMRNVTQKQGYIFFKS